jgi:hypothetical protein
MKKTSLVLVFVIFTITTKIMAQAKDSAPAKKVVEKGAQGDIILGRKNKKNQLNASPQQLQQKDSVQREASTQSKKKKSKSKGRKGEK